MIAVRTLIVGAGHPGLVRRQRQPLRTNQRFAAFRSSTDPFEDGRRHAREDLFRALPLAASPSLIGLAL